MAADNMVAKGLALFWPVISGTAVRVAHKAPLPPMEALGSMPMEPVNMEAFVSQYVPKHILGHDNIKLPGISDQLHGTIIYIHMSGFYLGIFLFQSAYGLSP